MSDAAGGPEYTREETIAELESWKSGGRMYPVEVAVSAVYWLELPHLRIRAEDSALRDYVLRGLRDWFGDESPHLPVDLAENVLRCLKSLEEQ